MIPVRLVSESKQSTPNTIRIHLQQGQKVRLSAMPQMSTKNRLLLKEMESICNEMASFCEETSYPRDSGEPATQVPLTEEELDEMYGEMVWVVEVKKDGGYSSCPMLFNGYDYKHGQYRFRQILCDSDGNNIECHYVGKDYAKTWFACRYASDIDKVQLQSQQKQNEKFPLTKEELNEMCGDMVWVAEVKKDGSRSVCPLLFDGYDHRHDQYRFCHIVCDSDGNDTEYRYAGKDHAKTWFVCRCASDIYKVQLHPQQKQDEKSQARLPLEQENGASSVNDKSSAKPLTVAELMELEGEIVWVVHMSKTRAYPAIPLQYAGFINGMNDNWFLFDCFNNGRPKLLEHNYLESDYARTWLAYLRNPDKNQPNPTQKEELQDCPSQDCSPDFKAAINPMDKPNEKKCCDACACKARLAAYEESGLEPEAVRQLASNDPLPLNELWDLPFGEWVWIEREVASGGGTVNCGSYFQKLHTSSLSGKIRFGHIGSEVHYTVNVGHYGKKWAAYRHRPEVARG